LSTLLATNTLRLAAKKTQAQDSIGLYCKKMWPGHLSTFPKSENIFEIKKLFLTGLHGLFCTDFARD
jgi:hypothetical protein